MEDVITPNTNNGNGHQLRTSADDGNGLNGKDLDGLDFLDEETRRKIAKIQAEGSFVLVVNPFQQIIRHANEEIDFLPPESDRHYVAGAILIRKHWSDTYVLMAHGEGVFVDLETKDIIQTGEVVTVIKTDPNLIKVANIKGMTVHWFDHIVIKLIERIQKNQKEVANAC